MKKLLSITVSLVLILFVSVVFFSFKKRLYTLDKKQKGYEQAFYALRSQKEGHCFPIELENIPFAEDSGIVLNVKKVELSDVPVFYNASIIEKENQFLLFFRFDELDYRHPKTLFTRIGCAELDRHFEQTDREIVRIDTGSNFSEDPRILEKEGEYILVYNDLSGKNSKRRSMHIAHINPTDYSVNAIQNFDIGRSPIEKNWAPFVFDKDLFFEYHIAPRSLLKLVGDEVVDVPIPEAIAKQSLRWPGIWGKIRGGTPARKIGGQYLGFFHSAFRGKEGIIWYVMGAYTFEAEPPFRVTSISHYPILFKEMYTSPPLNGANPMLRCVFPSGFALENKEGKELIHLSCGENDSCVKIITIDKNALFKSLKKL